MQKRWIFNLLVFAAVVCGTAVSASATDFVVIVNAANPTTSISRAELASIFLKQEKTWPDGQAITPVDQTASSPVREAFSTEILRRSVGAVKAYWEKQIFSGSAVPPVEQSSDTGVAAIVSTTRGAVGYVGVVQALSSGKVVVRLPAGVKVLRIED